MQMLHGGLIRILGIALTLAALEANWASAQDPKPEEIEVLRFGPLAPMVDPRLLPPPLARVGISMTAVISERWPRPDSAEERQATYWVEGAAIGGAIGAAVFWVAVALEFDEPFSPSVGEAIGGTFVGAFPGALSGALIGSAHTKDRTKDD